MTKTTQHSDGKAWISPCFGRGLLQSHSTILSFILFAQSVLAFPSCAGLSLETSDGKDNPDSTQVVLEVKAGDDACSNSNIDIFFFDWDSTGRLDSYQRNLGGGLVTTSSRLGTKRLVVLAGAHGDRYMWADINDYSDLRENYFKLSDDDPAAPFMSGVAKVEAGVKETVAITLRPLMAKVTLRSISFDLSGRGQPGVALDSARVYLINVSALCTPVPTAIDLPVSYLNYGGLSAADTVGVGKLVYADLPDKIGQGKTVTDKTLYCYPNSPKKDEVGTPLTRLVIEGKIGGETCYYPIDVGARNSPGISNGVEYVLDVAISRRGSLDPDTPLSSGMTYSVTALRNWTEKDDTIILY